MRRDRADGRDFGCCGRLRRERVEVPFISSTPGDDRMFGRVRVGSRAPVILTSSRGLPIDPDHAAAYPLSPAPPAQGSPPQNPCAVGPMTVRRARSGRLPPETGALRPDVGLAGSQRSGLCSVKLADSAHDIPRRAR